MKKTCINFFISESGFIKKGKENFYECAVLNLKMSGAPQNLLFPRWTPFAIQQTPAFIAALSTIFSAWVSLDLSRSMTFNNELYPSDPKCQHSTYDYIVVGGGTAGMIIATRLANASRDIRVLLLEAGGRPHYPLNYLPSCNFYAFDQPSNTYTYRSVPQRYACQSCDGKRAFTTRGKMLGGSSSINFMLYARGDKEDYNSWAIDANDTQWSYENVLPYFKKSENYQGAYARDESSKRFHGSGGLLNVATTDFMPGVNQLLAAAKEKGFKIRDYNGEDQEGFSKIDLTTQNGWRESTYRAFYMDTGKPPNLCIKTFATVTKLNFAFNSKKPRVVGVTYERHSQKRTVRATQEVILTAGTMESPKLLLLSGVGPSPHLHEMNIPVVKDLPVGENFQDHVTTLALFPKGPSVNLNTMLTVRNSARLLFEGNGPLSSPVGFAGQGFITSPGAGYPNLHILQFSIGLYPDIPQMINNLLGLDAEVLDEWFHPYHRQFTDARLVVILLGRPKSSGVLTLSSRNPIDKPILDPKYLSNPEDVEALLYGYKKIVDIFENSTALNTPLFNKSFPACVKHKFKSDEYYKCVIRHLSASFYHHVGTCALGKVVDERLRVKGIDGLRVADASVIPRTPNAPTQTAVIMIGEKAADLIIDDLNHLF